MADHDDDVVVVAASFFVFFNGENANVGLHHCILLLMYFNSCICEMSYLPVFVTLINTLLIRAQCECGLKDVKD